MQHFYLSTVIIYDCDESLIVTKTATEPQPKPLPRKTQHECRRRELPALVLSLAYHDLAIKEGGHAASQYHRMVFVETDWVERATIEEALRRYCARDTLTMVKLSWALKEKAQMKGA